MQPHPEHIHHMPWIVWWFKHQNWFILASAMVGWLNAIVAGARVMGWNQLADFCGKLEDAIQAMVNAWLNRKNQNPNEGTKTTLMLLAVILLCGCAITREMNATLVGDNIKTVYGTGNVNATYQANTTWRVLWNK